jgi:hypothetical protein
MQDPPVEVETIVRLVLQRVRAIELAGEEPEGRSSQQLREVSSREDVRLTQRLVTLESLPDRFDVATRVLEVDSRAIVTPAVLDELKRHGVQLRRVDGLLVGTGGSSDDQGGQPHVTLLGAGQCIMHAVDLAKDLRLRAIGGCGIPEREVMEVRSVIEQGCRRIVWATPLPYAAMVAACQTESLSGVWLPNPGDLPTALDQSQPNVMIVERAKWSAAALAGLARTWTRRMP